LVSRYPKKGKSVASQKKYEKPRKKRNNGRHRSQAQSWGMAIQQVSTGCHIGVNGVLGGDDQVVGSELEGVGDYWGEDEAKTGIRNDPEGGQKYPEVFRKADRLPRRIECIFPEKIGKITTPLSCTTIKGS
jgi:hypothetical protein